MIFTVNKRDVALFTAERKLPLYGGLIGLLFGVGMVVFDLITSDKPIIAVGTSSGHLLSTWARLTL